MAISVTLHLTLCQCPLGLMPHFYPDKKLVAMKGEFDGVNALSGLCLISTEVADDGVRSII